MLSGPVLSKRNLVLYDLTSDILQSDEVFVSAYPNGCSLALSEANDNNRRWFARSQALNQTDVDAPLLSF